ncbi:MAG: hypothetical protein U0793_24225 [Gemmataceae bacterium]
MNEQPVNLNSDERRYLRELLEATLKETRVEEHRTKTPSYREHIVHDRQVIQGLLAKLGEPNA